MTLIVCEVCAGEGWVYGTHEFLDRFAIGLVTCEVCGGRGVIEKDEREVTNEHM